MSRKRWPLIAAALVCLVLELVFIIWRPYRKADTSGNIIATAQRGPLEAGVKCTGTVIPCQQRSIMAPVPACVDQVNVAVGDQVEQGRVLARLSSPDAVSALRLAEASLRLSEAQLAQMGGPGADAGGTALGLAEQRVAKAELQLKQRQNDVASLNVTSPIDGVVSLINVAPGDQVSSGGAVASVIDLDALRVTASISAYQYSEYHVGQVLSVTCWGMQRIGRITSLSPLATGTQQQFAMVVELDHADDGIRPGLVAFIIDPEGSTIQGTVMARMYTVTANAAAKVTSVRAHVGGAVAHGEMLLQLESDQARIAVRDAELELESARAALATVQGAKPATGNEQIAVQAARVEQARLQYLRAQSDVEALTVTAPISGVVTACSIRPGDETGAQPLFTIADLNGAVINATVNETDVVKLKAPMDARVVVAALPDRQYEARLTSVGLQPVQGNGPSAYPVRFEIADATDIRPGMTGSVTIILARRESAVYVPSEALRKQYDHIYLDVMKSDDEITAVEVVVGIANDVYTEIVSGVYEGQRVVIGPSAAGGGLTVPSLWTPAKPSGGR